MTRGEMHIKALSKGIDSQTIKGSMTVILLGHAVDMMMELQDAHEAELGAAKKVAQDAYTLGASQAAEMDRFWGAFGLLDENISVDDAIAFFKAKDKGLLKSAEKLQKCIDLHALCVEKSKEKDMKIAELTAIIERMKCCENCVDYSPDGNGGNNCPYERNRLGKTLCEGEDDNFSQWQPRGNPR